MMSLNRAQIIGNVTRDPETRVIPSGQSVANFSVATNAVWTDAQGQKQERTEFHDIVAWGKLSEICGQYLAKGRRVFVEGRLQTREWETPEGQKRRKTEIIAENVIMLDRPPSASGSGQPSYVPAQPSSAPVQHAEPSMGDQEIRVEDIPF
jgi:single-strand DNA-binding protein